MNTDRVKELARHLRDETRHVSLSQADAEPVDPNVTDQFNMAQWTFTCGAPACLAGHACALFSDSWDDVRDKDRIAEDRIFKRLGTKLLGLSPSVGERLFDPVGFRAQDYYRKNGFRFLASRDLHTISVEEAATVLDHLAETGEVDWDVLLTEPDP